MSPRFKPMWKVLCVLAIVGSPGVARAQFGKVAPGAPAQAQPEHFKGKGKIAGIMPDGRGGAFVLMTNEKGETWVLKFSKSSKLRVQGKGSLDMLSMGTTVRFDAMFDRKKGHVKDPVKKLLICGLLPEYTLGRYEDPSAPVAGGQLESDYKSTQLTGKLVGLKGTSMMIMVPGEGKIRFDVTEDVDIDADLNFNPAWDYTGDEIDVSGTKGEMPQLGGAGRGMARARMGRGTGRMMPGKMPPGAAGAAGGAAGAAPGGAAGAAAPAAGGFGGAAGAGAAISPPAGLINVREAKILKAQFSSGRGGRTAKPEAPAEKNES